MCHLSPLNFRTSRACYVSLILHVSQRAPTIAVFSAGQSYSSESYKHTEISLEFSQDVGVGMIWEEF